MPVKFYYDILSQPARSVLLFIKANDIPLEEKPIALLKGEHKTEDYKLVNQFQKVPVIDHDGFKLSESAAILQYLANAFEVKDHWYPKSSKARARVDEYLAWHHANMRKNAVNYVRQVVIIPMMTKTPVDEEVKKTLEAEYDKTLDEFEQFFLANGAHFIGGQNDISIADVLACQEIDTNANSGHDSFTNRPVLKAYMERVRAKLQPHYSNVLRQFGELVAKMKAPQ